MQLDDIRNLALKARIEIPEAEMQSIADDFDSILKYVNQIQAVAGDPPASKYVQTNVLRDDVATNEPGVWTEGILKNAPDTENGYLKVGQIL